MNSFKVRFKLLIFYKENSHLFERFLIQEKTVNLTALLYSSLKQSPTEGVTSFTAENGWQLYKQLIVSGIELEKFLTYRPSAIHRQYIQNIRRLLHCIRF